MAEKATLMILKVSDLQCPCCYRKVKKILCKFPQIRDQVYDEKQNLVKITVVCCSPEKIRNELYCMGLKFIKSIEILEPPKPKPKPINDKGHEDPAPKLESPKNPKPRPAPPPQEITVPVLGVPHPHPQVPPPCYDNCGYAYGYGYGYGYFYGYGKGCNASCSDCVHEENIRSCRCGCGRDCHVSRCDYVHAGGCRCGRGEECHVNRCVCVHEENTGSCTNM